jgi:intracellular multiplication protein IcmV
MGIFSGIKQVAGQVVNFKLTDWFNTQNHKSTIGYIVNSAKSLFSPTTSTNQETFEQAMERLQLTEQDIVNRQKEFWRLFMISLAISIGLFLYTMFITIKYQNIYGFVLGVAVTILSLSKAFKYHFWLTQLNKRKLGLTLKDWLN